MEERRQHRAFIKNKPQSLWRESRDNFKKRCLEQFKRSREMQINQRRFGLSLTKENVISEEELLLQFIKNEWKSFLLNEERFTGDLNADLAAAAEEELLQELKRESLMYNSRSLEEEAEYVLQFEPGEMYQDELEQDPNMIVIDQRLMDLNDTQDFEYPQRLYDTLICSHCYQYKLSPVEGHLNLFQCSECNLYTTTRFDKTIELMEFE